MKHCALICLLVYLFIGLFATKAHAETMSNDNYNVTKDTIEIMPFKEPEKVPLPQTIPSSTTTNNYTVRTGLNNATDSFSVSLSQGLIDFGLLSATNPVIRELQIDVVSQSPYQILSMENHPLQLNNKETIPNTSCDNGSCTDALASLWTNTLTYGLGYRCENIKGTGCLEDFKEANVYKQFPDSSQQQKLKSLMQGTASTDTQAKIIYKINISRTQKAGGYNNSIIYLATPDF